MGVIVDELRRLMERGLDESQILLWFDPDRDYDDAVDELGLPGATILRYHDGFYRLRHEAEPFLRQPEKPRLLVYVPAEYDSARLPLAELVALAETLRPGEKGLANTRLGVIARRALKSFLPEAKLSGLDREIEENNLSVADLELLALGGETAAIPTALGVIYGTQSATDVTLAFLGDPELDTEVAGKNAGGELAELLKNSYSASVTAGLPLAEMRRTLRRHILSAELLLRLGNDTPAALKAVATPEDAAIAQRCVELASDWRNRMDLGASYLEAANDVEGTLHLAAMDLPFSALARVETFAEIERQLIRQVAKRIVAGPSSAEFDQAEKVASQRRKGFWATREPEFQPRWDLLIQSGELMRLCGDIDEALKAPAPVAILAAAYTAANRPWCRLDSLHRNFEKKASSIEFLLTEHPTEIEELVTATRRRYTETSGKLAEAFVRALAAADFDLTGWYRQTETFERAVSPDMGSNRVAYLMVDALRYELATELVDMLSADFEVELQAVSGTVPGITDVGMAALLPHAATGFTVRAGKKDTVEVGIGDVIFRNREDRIAYLEQRAGVPTVALRLEDPKQFKTKLKKLGDGPGLVVVTSREIDRVAEEDLTEARRYMDDVLRHVRLAVYLLAKAGIEHFVIATDHGYLFGEDLADSEKIDAPGGHTLLLHRRVWVGQGGAASESYLRTTLKKIGVSSDLELAVPWNLAAFKCGGSEAYFHGGLSPQEFLLPLIRLRPRASLQVTAAKKIAWEVKLGSAKITTVHLTVTVAGHAGFFDAEWPRVRVEVRSSGEPCSIAVSAGYGFSDATGEIALRGQPDKPGETEPNSITLMLTPKAPRAGTVNIHLVDAVSGVDLLPKPISVEVSRVF